VIIALSIPNSSEPNCKLFNPLRLNADAFNVAAAKALSKIKDRVKTAVARGDVSADQKALDQAIIAFKAKYESLTGYKVSEN
jgi:hypothetical protein